MNEQTDRLIDVLLWEEIGSAWIPDVTERVLTRAFRRRRRVWVQVAAVAASVVVCVLAGWWAIGRRYPGPEAAGSYKIFGAAEVRRGAVLVTESLPASLALGGYCDVRLDPNTRLRIDGTAGSEEVFLERGGVRCEVNRGVGAFTVRSPVGSVSVLGTSFSVALVERTGGEGGVGSRKAGLMAVAVTAGSVSVDYNGGTFQLSAGARQVFGEEAGRGPNQPAAHGGAERVTVTGLAKALAGPNTRLNPSVASATLTVTMTDAAGNVTQDVYEVYGWAGVILANEADGKKVEVTGVAGEKGGKKTITGKSVDVKIIVVEEKPDGK